MANQCDQPSDPGQISQDLTKLLAGETVSVNAIDFQRNDAMKYVPKTKVTTGYIVMVLLFNDHGQVLMVQEAKESCYGTWYLPAGRLEPNETLVEGAKREVKEEAGLECDISTLLSVHFGGARWIRFSFFGKVTGGKLKTLKEKDCESLQALFFDVDAVIDGRVELRARDVIPAIRQAVEYKDSLHASRPVHYELLPALASHALMLHRVVLVADLGPGGLMMLASRTDQPHVCSCAVSPRDASLMVTVQAIVRMALQGETLVPTIHGVLSVEHNGANSGKDGVCITTLVSLPLSAGSGLPDLRDKNFFWMPVTEKGCIKAVCDGMNGFIVKLIDRS